MARLSFPLVVLSVILASLVGDTKGYSEIMVMGGTNDGFMSNVEIVALDDDDDDGNRTCTEAADLPVACDSMVVVAPFKNSGEVTACGGWMSTLCYTFSARHNNWTTADFRLEEARLDAASILLDGGNFAVFGGWVGGFAGNRTSTTEVISNDGDSTFITGPDMPFASSSLCAVKVNSTHVFLAGGVTWEGVSATAYLYDMNVGEWTRLPDMEAPRRDHACGLVNDADVVVAGGSNTACLDTAEIFSLRTGSWRRGPSLPAAACSPSAAQLDKTFVVTGGCRPKEDDGEGNEYRDTVYYGDIIQFDEAARAWTLRPERLRRPRCFHNAVLLPPQMRMCH